MTQEVRIPCELIVSIESEDHASISRHMSESVSFPPDDRLVVVKLLPIFRSLLVSRECIEDGALSMVLADSAHGLVGKLRDALKEQAVSKP